MDFGFQMKKTGIPLTASKLLDDAVRFHSCKNVKVVTIRENNINISKHHQKKQKPEESFLDKYRKQPVVKEKKAKKHHKHKKRGKEHGKKQNKKDKKKASVIYERELIEKDAFSKDPFQKDNHCVRSNQDDEV